jgi:hypothetical protein
MGYALMSENACDGYRHGNEMEIPSSPLSEMSDWSSSTTTDCMSAPMSPSSPSSDEELSIKKPLKPSLKRAGAASRKRTVTWDPNVVFETRPWSGKRRRAQVDDGDDELETAVMAGYVDAELKAPIPTKRAKLAEIETQASAVSLLQFLPSIAPPVFPEASRTVIPSFNFNSLLLNSTANDIYANTAATVEHAHFATQSSQSCSLNSSSSSSYGSTVDPSIPPPSRPSFVPFTFVTPKRNPQSSLLKRH